MPLIYFSLLNVSFQWGYMAAISDRSGAIMTPVSSRREDKNEKWSTISDFIQNGFLVLLPTWPGSRTFQVLRRIGWGVLKLTDSSFQDSACHKHVHISSAQCWWLWAWLLFQVSSVLMLPELHQPSVCSGMPLQTCLPLSVCFLQSMPEPLQGQTENLRGSWSAWWVQFIKSVREGGPRRPMSWGPVVDFIVIVIK